MLRLVTISLHIRMTTLCRYLALTPLTFVRPQTEFLNSVIVDLQRKNEDLKGQLETMVAASLNGNNASELDNYDG